MNLQLLTFNMKWYRVVMREMLMRYKLFIFVVAALLAPSFSGAITLMVMPFNHILTYPNFNLKLFVVSLVVVQLISLLWANLHYKAILNRPWDGFLKTLPFSKMRSVLIDIMPIFYIDCIGWLIFMIAVIKIFLQNQYSVDLIILLIAKSFLLASLLVLPQLIFLKQKFLMAISLIISDFLFAYSTTCLSQIVQLFCVLALIVCSLIFIHLCCQQRQTKRYFSFEKNILSQKSFCLPSTFLWLPIKLLMHGSRQLIIIWCLLLLITSFSFFVGYHGPLDATHSFILIACLFLNILLASNFFSYLHVQWQTQRNFLSTLPISYWQLFVKHYLLVASLTTFLNAVILFIMIFSNNIDIAFLYKIFVVLILTNILLAMTYFSQIHCKRYGLLISFVMTLIFIISTIWNVICHNHCL
ncbi:MAG: hypothetical protein ACD_46C00237G0004 [uncultured bacterium]|nr:MAG: hypothetical protein ACD_46C00237G0004 [uncultured bacterium]